MDRITRGLRAARGAFDPAERRRLGLLAAAVAGLHAAGWGLVALYAGDHPVVVGLGGLAYSFGLRHAFDVDHIAAIDNTTRKLLGDGRRPLAVGFAFSLGHSTVVLGLTVLIAAAVTTLDAATGAFSQLGGTIGASVSGAFLIVIGVLNLVVLLDVLALARAARRGELDEHRLERRLRERGLLNRLLPARVVTRISRSWHLYPLGVLFGLGFDTATEVGLLALSAGAAGGGTPLPAILALPLLFAAGMALMDTADGVFMAKAYAWAFSTPVRKLFYNVTVTSLSVTIALSVGVVELLQVAADRLHLDSGFWRALGALDFEQLGYVVVGLFVLTWAVAFAIWKGARVEQRWSPMRDSGAGR
jgi:nickel/cobalt transporter (NiCoT) family protein